MKFVSPLQRGSTCTCRWLGHAGAGGPADVHAEVDAVGRVRGADRPQRAHLRRARRAISSSSSRSSKLATWRVGATIRWPEPYGIEVHHRDRLGRALEHERLGVVGRVDELAHDAADVGAAGVADRTRTSTRQPAHSRSRLIGCGAHRCSTTSAASCAMNVVERDVALGVVAPPPVHADRAVLDVGVADDEHVRHLLGLGPPDARAERAVRAVDHLGPEARRPSSRSTTCVARSRRGGRRRAAPSPAPARATPGTRPRSARRAPRRTARSIRTARGGS